MSYLSVFESVGRLGCRLWQTIAADGTNAIGHQIGHGRAQIDSKTIGQMFDMKNAYIEVQEEMCACRVGDA